MAPMVAGEVSGDAEEPGARLLVAADLLEALPGPQKRLLGNIVAGLLVAGNAPEVAEDGALMRVEELLEGRLPCLRMLLLSRGSLSLAARGWRLVERRCACERAEPAGERRRAGAMSATPEPAGNRPDHALTTS